MENGMGNSGIAGIQMHANFVDDELLRQTRPGSVEEDGLIERTVLLVEELVFDGHGDAELVPLLVYALQLAGYVAHFLRLVLAAVGELDILALAEAAELDNFVLVSFYPPHLFPSLYHTVFLHCIYAIYTH